MRIILIFAILTCLPLHLLFAETPNSIAITCDFMENVGGTGWQVVDSRSFQPPLGGFQFSMGNFSCDLTTAQLNDTTVKIESRLTAFDFAQKNLFSSVTISPGAALFFDSVMVRGSSLFRVRLRLDSLSQREFDCQYRVAGDDFKFDPSGDFDFYYVAGSLGDYRWNQIRDAIEQSYDRIRERIDLYEPTKINYFISPCKMADVGWDGRWENGLDIARNNLYVYYTHGINDLHVETVFMMKLLRLWGYAPGVILEGAASQVEACDMFAKDFRNEGRLPKISTLGITRDYRKLDRRLAAYSAGSFVHYLLLTRGITRFESFYRRVTDLTLPETFQTVYNEPLTTVEEQWENYLDTLIIGPAVYIYHRYRAETLMKYDEAILYLDRELAATADTVHLGSKLANLYFLFGRYEDAERIFRAVLRDPESEPIANSYLANLLLIEGKIDDAESYYRLALAQDTTNNYQPEYKLGLIAQYRGDDLKALEFFAKSRAKTESVPVRVDIDIAAGDSYYSLGIKDSARMLYQGALDTAKILLGNFTDRPLFRFRVGKAALRLGEGANALEHLKGEFFVEERMYYIGQILLAMGQAYDLLGDREAAKEEYRQVFLYPTAWLDRELADKYMRTPYYRE